MLFDHLMLDFESRGVLEHAKISITAEEPSSLMFAGIGAGSGIAGGAGIFLLSAVVLLGHLLFAALGSQLLKGAFGRRQPLGGVGHGGPFFGREFTMKQNSACY